MLHVAQWRAAPPAAGCGPRAMEELWEMRVPIHFPAGYQAVPLVLERGVTLTCGLGPPSILLLQERSVIFVLLVFVLQNDDLQHENSLHFNWIHKNSCIVLKAALVVEDLHGSQLSVSQDRQKKVEWKHEGEWQSQSFLSSVELCSANEAWRWNKNCFTERKMWNDADCDCKSSRWTKPAFISFSEVKITYKLMKMFCHLDLSHSDILCQLRDICMVDPYYCVFLNSLLSFFR